MTNCFDLPDDAIIMTDPAAKHAFNPLLCYVKSRMSNEKYVLIPWPIEKCCWTLMWLTLYVTWLFQHGGCSMSGLDSYYTRSHNTHYQQALQGQRASLPKNLILMSFKLKYASFTLENKHHWLFHVRNTWLSFSLPYLKCSMCVNQSLN